MVGIVKQTGTVNKNSGIVVNKKMIVEVVAILIVALVAIAALEVFQSPTASTGLQVKNAQQSEQEVSTGAATSSQNAIVNGQETSTDLNYQPKFNPSGGATHGDATWQEMTVNDPSLKSGASYDCLVFLNPFSL